ncbi:hypothetical protein E8E11_002982 [Didymella keratinophila]|nr:hypothetical protein E8E11_002982 [Didymella keratinophila]
MALRVVFSRRFQHPGPLRSLLVVMDNFSLVEATIAGVKACRSEIHDSWLILCTIVRSLSGEARGVDEGNIGSVIEQKIFQKAFQIPNQTDAQYANTKGWIVSIATAGAVFGCLACIAPKSIRGLVSLQYACDQQLGVVFGFFFDSGIPKHHAGIIFTPESPGLLLAQNKPTEALRVLCKLLILPVDHEYVKEEIAGVQRQLEHEIEAVGVSLSSHVLLSVLVFSIYVIDFIGRRRSLMLGISLQIIILAFVGTYLGVTNGDTVAMIKASASATAAIKASIVAIYIHAVAWSIGWFSIPYLVSAEMFPICIRSLNISILMAFHWAFYFGCSRAIPSLLAATKRYGAFVFFACMCCISLVYRPWCIVHKVAYVDLDGLAGRLFDYERGDLEKADVEKVEDNSIKR